MAIQRTVRRSEDGMLIFIEADKSILDFYTWTRDAALTLMDLIHDFLGGESSLEPVIQQYMTAQAKLQRVSNPSGTLSDGSGLGEPKFHVNITAFTEPWGRPQRDGPALRALALIDYRTYLISKGKQSKV